MTTPKFSIPMKAIRFDAIASELQDWSEQLKKVAAVAKTQPDESLAVFNWPSAETALGTIKKFIDKANDSRSRALLGNPIPIGDSTPGAKRKNPPPSTAQMSEILAKGGMPPAKKAANKATKKKGQA